VDAIDPGFEFAIPLGWVSGPQVRRIETLLCGIVFSLSLLALLLFGLGLRRIGHAVDVVQPVVDVGLAGIEVAALLEVFPVEVVLEPHDGMQRLHDQHGILPLVGERDHRGLRIRHAGGAKKLQRTYKHHLGRVVDQRTREDLAPQ